MGIDKGALVQHKVPRRGQDLLTDRAGATDLRSTLVSPTGDGAGLASEIADELGPVLAAMSGTPAERATALHVLLGEIRRLHAAGIITVDHSCLTCAHFRPATGRSAARCLLLGMALHHQDLRVDCPDHEPVAAD